MSLDNSAFATRGDAMQMIYNSLDAPIMEVRENVEIDGTVETVVMIYDGKSNPFISFRKILSGILIYLLPSFRIKLPLSRKMLTLQTFLYKICL